MAIERARKLRNAPTDAETRLWSYLRKRRTATSHFRRQVPTGAYVVDFCCHGEKIIIEVDGGQHGLAAEMVRDLERTKWLESRGYRVLRFWNNEVLQNLEGVVDLIENDLSPTRGAARRALPARGRANRGAHTTDV
jgi:very-short-patch-repair endonuclease